MPTLVIFGTLGKLPRTGEVTAVLPTVVSVNRRPEKMLPGKL
jgi:hypothetical protein